MLVSIFSFFGMIPFLVFWETSIMLQQFTFPSMACTVSNLSTTLAICILFDDSHSDRCEVMSRSFDLHFTSSITVKE